MANRKPSPAAPSAAGLALALAAAGPARAQMYKPDLVQDGNRWTITFFDDSSPVHAQWATQGVCFEYLGPVGTHQRYRWWSDTYPDWNGIATQEGDQIFMHGDYAKDAGHDGIQWEIVTASPRSQGAGHWQEWREDGGFGRTIGFGNAHWSRVGRCQVPFLEAQYLRLPLDLNGKPMESPQGNGPETAGNDSLGQIK